MQRIFNRLMGLSKVSRNLLISVARFFKRKPSKQAMYYDLISIEIGVVLGLWSTFLLIDKEIVFRLSPLIQ